MILFLWILLALIAIAAIYVGAIRLIKGLLALHFAKTQEIAYSNAAGGDTSELRAIGRAQIAGCALITKNSVGNEFVHNRDTAEFIIQTANIAAGIATGLGDITQAEASEFLEDVKNILHQVLFAGKFAA